MDFWSLKRSLKIPKYSTSKSAEVLEIYVRSRDIYQNVRYRPKPETARKRTFRSVKLAQNYARSIELDLEIVLAKLEIVRCPKSLDKSLKLKTPFKMNVGKIWAVYVQIVLKLHFVGHLKPMFTRLKCESVS